MHIKTVIYLYIVFFALATNTHADEIPSFNITEITTGVYVHQGKHQQVTSPDRDDIANIGFIVGQNCTAVIDTGGSLRIGQALREVIKKTTQVPVCYVINTHVHYDHLLGNTAFAEAKVKFVGHAKLRKALAANQSFFRTSFTKEMRGFTGSIPPLDITVDNQTRLDLGGRALILQTYITSHTNHDLTIYDEKTATLWTGDLLFMRRTPSADGSYRNWLTILQHLAKKKFDRVIPGHGPISAPWPTAANAQISYLQNLINETREIIRNGGYIEDAIEKVGKSQKTKWVLFDRIHRRNVTRAFAELEWE